MPSLPDDTNLETVEATEPTESFDAIVSEYERKRTQQAETGGAQKEATVIAVSADSVYLDIGYKTEGVLPLAPFTAANEEVKPGDKLLEPVSGRNAEGYYDLSRLRVEQPKDWASLERAFEEKAPIAGTVTALVKGGLTVDVGVRAFLPASRSGVRDAAELEKLVGEQIRCRIIKLDVDDEDVVVDRRVLVEEEERSNRERRYGQLKEGDVLPGEVRSLAGYGAFVNIGGVDALLHIGDIAWNRINKPEDVLTVGQQVEVKVLKVDPDKQRISVGMKQLLPHPWDSVALKTGDRVRGTVTRVADFGAFVEIEPGVEGLIHLSEMSWIKKVRKASDLLKQGDTVEAAVLGVNLPERRLSLGLKQTLDDPWADVDRKFPVGSAIEGPVTSFTKFGAFVELAEGVEGMVHVSEITEEKRLQHPQDALRAGQVVKAQVLEVDKAKRQIRLSMKQRTAVTLDEYLAEHPVGSQVTGRVVDVANGVARVELGDGIQGTCRVESSDKETASTGGKADIASLTSMLQARWKSGPSPAATSSSLSAGQIRTFRIKAGTKDLELELV
jgi:small subunit ribosomal protein S1